MIFSEDYDKSLWLVLSSDKETREKVRKLISMLPYNIYNEIQKMILEYRNGVYLDYRKSFESVDGYDYYVVVKIVNNRLLFNVNRWKEDKVRTEEEYTLNLIPVTKEELKEMDFFSKKNIGGYDSSIYDNITYSLDGSVETTEFSRRYIMRKIPFGVIVNTSFGRKIFNISGVNVNKSMPDEMFVMDFSSSDRISEIVKKKVRKRLGGKNDI